MKDRILRVGFFGFAWIYGIVSAVFLILGGVLARSKRDALYGLDESFGLRRFSLFRARPVQLSDVADVKQPIVMVELQGRRGNVTTDELTALCYFAKRASMGIFEFGTFDGRTTLNLALNAAPNITVHTIDLNPRVESKTRLDMAPGDKFHVTATPKVLSSRFEGSEVSAGKKIVQLYGDTATFDFSSYYGKIDFVFIDAAHSYEYVMNDTNRALALIGKGRPGIIAWHDYHKNWSGVTRALRTIHRTIPKLDIQYIEETNLAFSFLS